MQKTMKQKLDDVGRLVNQVRAGTGRGRVETVGPEKRLREELGLDSLDLAELTVRIQAEYGVDVFAKRNIATVDEILEQLP